MKTCYMILSAASVIPLLSSCSSQQQTSGNQLWNVKPAYNVRHSTETPESYYRLGRYYQGQKRHEQALAAYQKALALDGSFAEARNGIGVIYATQGRQQEAIEQFRLAAKLAPDAAHIQNNLGYALYLNKSYAEAVGALEQAVALSPDNRAAHTNLALALDKAGDKDKAVQAVAVLAEPQAAGNSPRESAVQTASAPAPAVATAAIPSPSQPALESGLISQAETKPVPAPAIAAAVPAAAPKPAQALPKGSGVTAAEAKPVPGPVVVAAVPALAPKPVQALPKGNVVIAQAEVKPVPQVETRPQAVQVKNNGYETRRQAEVHVQTAAPAKPVRQVSVQTQGNGPAIASAVQKQVPSAEPRMLAVRQASSAAGPYRIEVSNGNGVTGLARKVAGFLNKGNSPDARLTNQKPFEVSSTQVQYRSGYRDQAQSMASALPGKPGIAQASNLRWDVSVRVLLGKDMAGNVAHFEPDREKVRLARNGADS